MIDTINPAQFAQLLRSPMLAEQASVVSGQNCLIVDLNQHTDRSLTTQDLEGAVLTMPACPIIGLRDQIAGDRPGTDLAHQVDVFAQNEGELKRLRTGIEQQPLAATTLVQVLRHNAQALPMAGLLVESLAYSALQHSQGFTRWQQHNQHARQPPANRKSQDQAADDPVLQMVRDQNELTIRLNRPAKHNAYNQVLKDQLCEALQLACADEEIQQVILCANGPSFCAGGDLTEFGEATDAGSAHISRTTRSAAALLDKLAQQDNKQVTAHLHGACIGAGIELAAFAHHSCANADAYFQLPEVAMGLVPGAGGTVSVTRRIGRQKTAFMALTNDRINAQTALAWGLIDAIDT